MTDKEKSLLHKIEVQDRLIESLLEYIKTISPVEPEDMQDRRRAAKYLIHGKGVGK